jgi:predicted outer membrane repeat protein
VGDIDMTDPEGGAIYMDGWLSAGLLSVEDATFFGNTSDEDGGAIFATDVDLATITNSTFTDNHAIGESDTTEGGAVYFQSSGSLTVVGSRFTGNSAYEDGGAIDLDSEFSGDLTVLNSTFVNNHASGDLDADGGAIEGQGYTMTVSNSTFKGNVVTGLGGGGAISAETATITGSSFTRNTSQTHGGAVALSLPASSDLRLIRRNTFSRNEAQVGGGAITLGPCGATTRSEERLLFGANRFLGNRATEQRRTMNIERWEQCAP